jgi:hypothetical protein
MIRVNSYTFKPDTPAFGTDSNMGHCNLFSPRFDYEYLAILLFIPIIPYPMDVVTPAEGVYAKAEDLIPV